MATVRPVARLRPLAGTTWDSISALRSPWQPPHPVPARVATELSGTVERPPATAAVMVSSVTPAQRHTVLPGSGCAATGRSGPSKRSSADRSAGSSAPPSNYNVSSADVRGMPTLMKPARTPPRVLIFTYVPCPGSAHRLIASPGRSSPAARCLQNRRGNLRPSSGQVHHRRWQRRCDRGGLSAGGSPKSRDRQPDRPLPRRPPAAARRRTAPTAQPQWCRPHPAAGPQTPEHRQLPGASPHCAGNVASLVAAGVVSTLPPVLSAVMPPVASLCWHLPVPRCGGLVWWLHGVRLLRLQR